MYYGIDLGGTKIEGVVLAALNPDSIITRHRIDTEGKQGYDHVLDRIKSLVDELSLHGGTLPESIGIGTPGTLDPATGLLKNSNTLCLNNRPLDKDLENVLGIKVRLANDANCFALAEYTMGIVPQKFPEAKVVFGVILGTGVGGGIIIEGNIIRGHHGIAGEWGHMFLDETGEDCYCGRHGCVETIISGTALQQYYYAKTGHRKILQEIFSDLSDPDTAALKARFLHFYGKAIGQVINLLDPDVIILGGGLSNIDFLYTEGYSEAEKHIFNPILKTPIVKAVLGDSAGVFGAAMLTG